MVDGQAAATDWSLWRNPVGPVSGRWFGRGASLTTRAASHRLPLGAGASLLPRIPPIPRICSKMLFRAICARLMILQHEVSRQYLLNAPFSAHLLSVVLLHVPTKVPVLVTSMIGAQEPMGVSFQDLKATRP